MGRINALAVACAAAAALLAGCSGGNGGVDGKRIAAADQTPGEWITHGRTYGEQRFSPLDKINVANAGQLGLAWSYDLPETRGIEATPLMSDGVLYTTSSWSIVRAFDAKTGKLLWEYDPEVPRKTGVKACCDSVNRGVALWRGKVVFGTLDGRLEALDAKTGKKLWSVITVDQSKPYTITGAPRIIKGKVLIGNGGAELGVRGYLSAYDVDNGKLLWRFYTVPGEKETDDAASDEAMKIARPTWKGEFWKVGGGGTVWDSMAYDPDLDLLYIGVGNGSPWNRDIRSPGGGDNLFLSSIVALKPDTGQYVWHYQTTPGESWDYTATQHIILADMPIGGSVRKVLLQAPKNGFFYVIDRANGKLISAKNYVPVSWATHVDLTTGRPVETPNARYEKGVALAMPGPLGGHNWMPMAYSPKTNLVYIPAQEIPFPYMPPGGANANFRYQPGAWNIGVDTLAAALPDDEATLKAIRASLKGRLIAWDPATQTEKWSVPYSGPWNGGVLATAGGLVFQGSATGELAAFDAAGGKKVWAFDAQTGIVAPPMTYEIDGEQYVAIMAGWGGGFALTAGAGVDPRSDGPRRLLVFKLGGKQTLPPRPVIAREMPDLPAVAATPQQIAAGAKAYAEYCSVCHGASAVSEFSIPDLRFSPVTPSAEAFKGVVIDGDRVDNGMVSFAAYLKPDQAEGVRQYILSLAHAQKARMAAAKPAK
ncbi:PQQ-dependent dehydrogenase, methanol/ethanol family [Caulobacter mirabilis]|uniref:PQQ-dependent dehydrogenase, methanol/ethanol family n=1 Tax=Caulobacter mirabilis TaxID=69666 RepID=A0A2D2AZU0_9CAUL|nr:PQQ-dependent dehydrogenase, methanol/ethanol family [Caulobacter mirabilis]ATQ43512.1 PQQ-dependent dehydrogenase, methanol/ethanol family [Caulobacter mirabilis]